MAKEARKMSLVSSPKFEQSRPYIFLLLAFILIEATGAFEQVMIYAAIPFLMGHFQMDAAALSWTVTLFLLVGAGTAAISSRLADLYGRKRVLARPHGHLGSRLAHQFRLRQL
ncbi:hypothetical protein ACIP79_28285 [Streptomyces sp. NPDC088747]|uniref:hypothetical protein n=1 Tax=Streptomyces sp. NPDC088747 TaxID=3365886 RepID=UPI0037FA4431